MSGPEFATLSPRAQQVRLRAVALDAWSRFALGDARVRLWYQGYNTTYRVEAASGRRFALRLNVGSQKSTAELRAELAWLAALAADTELAVPVPQRTPDGDLVVEVWSESLGRKVPAVLFSWLPGRDLHERMSTDGVRALGRAMSVLHDHAAGFRPPKGAHPAATDDVLLHLPDRLSAPHPLLDRSARKVVAEAVARVAPHYAGLYASSRPRLLHGDLHAGNVKWCRGRLAVFDFDDCVLGAPGYDLAVSCYYLRPDRPAEDALFEGYASRRPLPDVAPERHEAVVAGRNLLLLNELLGSETAAFRDLLPTFVANTVLKQRAYLRTGVFRHDVEGTVPLF